MTIPNQQFTGPGFVAVLFDIPFPISIPNGAYIVYDPRKEVACVQVTLREGSKAFFRNRPIIGPTSFEDLKTVASELERPRQDHSHLVTNFLTTGEEKATLNIHSGSDGGYSECKYYSEVCVTFLTDDIAGSDTFVRACEVLNPFLDKYRLLNEDYRVAHISVERNFYLATCHTSPLARTEIGLQPRQLFDLLGQTPRTFHNVVGMGASYVLRTNSFELLGPKGPLVDPVLKLFVQFIRDGYELPLSYELIMEALNCLQKLREYRLAVIHAETAFEVYVVDRLVKLMVGSGMLPADAATKVEGDRQYWGVKNKIRRFDDWTNDHCIKNGTAFVPFQGSLLAARWESDLYSKRNAAVHSGARNFSYDEASAAIAIAKECIVTLESRIPSMADRVHLNPSMAGFRQNAGEVAF
jgi:hypothetical protein